MTEREPFRDNPRLEQQVAVLFERIGTYMANTTQRLERMEAMLNTALHLRSDVDRQGEWLTKHDIHHGEDDTAIARRLLHDDAPIGKRFKDIEAVMHDATVRHGVYISAWRVVAWVIGIVVAAGGGGVLLGRFA